MSIHDETGLYDGIRLILTPRPDDVWIAILSGRWNPKIRRDGHAPYSRPPVRSPKGAFHEIRITISRSPDPTLKLKRHRSTTK